MPVYHLTAPFSMRYLLSVTPSLLSLLSFVSAERLMRGALRHLSALLLYRVPSEKQNRVYHRIYGIWKQLFTYLEMLLKQ